MLGTRATTLRERMDDPHCNPRLLRNTYEQFRIVNRLVSGWTRLFDRYLLPRAGRQASLLDIGSGGGDVALLLARHAARRGVELRVTGIDPDERANRYARERWREAPFAVRFERATAQELLERGESFDFVVSNHLLHHLPEERLAQFLEVSGSLARRLALHNDLLRHPLAFGLFWLGALPFRDSFIRDDGLRSIRRAFTAAELRGIVPPGWQVHGSRPFRNVLLLERGNALTRDG